MNMSGDKTIHFEFLQLGSEYFGRDSLNRSLEFVESFLPMHEGDDHTKFPLASDCV